MRIAQPIPPRSDQWDELRPEAASSARQGISLAVTSGKGGVGKTNIAVNLAVCLARCGKRVTLVDLDVGLADADLLLNIEPRYNLSHVLSGERTIDEIVVDAPGAIRFVAGGSGVHSLTDMEPDARRRLAQEVWLLNEKSEFVIYDCGAGISANVMTFAQSAHIVLVVSTSEPTALTDAYVMVKMLSRRGYHGNVQWVVNMVRTSEEARAIYRRAAAVAERFLHFRLADGGYVLHDSHVESAVRSRSPFVLSYPHCPSSMCLTTLAARVMRACSSAPPPDGLLSRFVGLFA